MRVGFIGLGAQGAPMAQQIIDAGFPTTLWARRPETLAPYAGSRARVAESPAELASESDLICLCVTGDADVEHVVDAMDESIAAGTIVAVQSTVHPTTCLRLADRVAARGATVIDAPVSGGGRAAAARELLVIVGGDDAPVTRARPVFETYGDPVLHLGPLGSGQLAKLLNNVLFQANVKLASDALRLGSDLGIDEDTLAQVLHSGSGQSYGLDILTEFGAEELVRIGGVLARKDFGIVSRVVADHDLDGGVLIDAAQQGLPDARSIGAAPAQELA